MRILMLAERLARTDADSPWLMDDLAASLVEEGAEVDVVLADIDRPRPRGRQEPTTSGPAATGVFSVGPEQRPRTRAGRVLARATAMLRMRRACRTLARTRRYDAVVFTSIASVYGGSAEVARRASGGHTSSVYFLWDFFPTHHVQIGRLPNGVWVPWLKRLERWSMGSPDVTFVMSPANAAHLRRYFGDLGRVEVQSPWSTSSSGVDSPPPSPHEGPFTVVFGGQLVAGRNVETLVDAARLVEDVTDEVRVVIAGSGPDFERLQGRVQDLGLSNTELTGTLPRAEYGELLRAAHVGISTTPGGVDVPTFPSKVGEYCRYGRAMVIAAEEASDVGDFVVAQGAGVSVPAGDPAALASAILHLWRRWQAGGLSEMEAAAWRTFRDHLSSDVAATRIMAVVRDLEAGRGA